MGTMMVWRTCNEREKLNCETEEDVFVNRKYVWNIEG